jgi:hypothetical protein
MVIVWRIRRLSLRNCGRTENAFFMRMLLKLNGNWCWAPRFDSVTGSLPSDR